MDHYVVLEPEKNEQFLTEEETLHWIQNWLNSMNELPQDLLGKSSFEDAAKHLLETACELEINRGFKIQWFAIRLDSPNH
tara:strand:- start:2119 stop:2358 length:240 start_codon:yes stop_codon:yes gene_type:complete